EQTSYPYCDQRFGAVNPSTTCKRLCANRSLLTACGESSRQAVQDVQAPVDGLVVGRVAKTEMAVSAAERVPGDNYQVIVESLGHEFAGRAPRGLRKRIEGAFRLDYFEAVFQSLVEPVAFAVVVGDNGGHVIIPGDYARVLDHARGADEAELLKLDHLFHYPPPP